MPVCMGWPLEGGEGEGFFVNVFQKTKNQQVGEVSANSRIAVKSVTHERIDHQQLGISLKSEMFGE